MKALRFHGPGDVRVDEIDEPTVRPGTVKIAVAWCGICGTDLHEFLEGPIFVPADGHPHPLSGETPPVTLGHEFSGTVEELGEGVEGLAVGDGVVVEPYFVCDDCDPCRSGNYNLCTRMGFIGLAGGGGGLGEKVVVDARWVHPVGDVPLDQAALVEPLAVGHHAVERSGVQAGQTAFVGGAGPIGLLLAAVLKGIGVRTVLSEVSSARKEKARETGVADLVLDPTVDDVPARVAELTGGRGADVAFECAGVDAVLDLCLEVVRPAGVVVNVSIWGHRPVVDVATIVLKEIDLRGTIAYRRDHAATIELVASGRVDPAPFITARIALEEVVEEGFDTLVHRKDTAVKILVHP
ncbi:2,3-butanediol dehydrogenase [Kineococcus gynurae]|uniref:2,3-butanediol dehydrogenase n=1 Tax=Kineococcus gynurae TaxID=452979 RepID=A0ABV5LT92_9ACTN